MTTAILIAAAILLPPCTYWFAGMCAVWDNAEIDYRLAHGGQSLRHGPMWRFRALVVGVPAIVIGMLLGGWVTALCMAAGCAAVFAMRHRYRLNNLRGLDWRYIAPWSNVYDEVIYRLRWGHIAYYYDGYLYDSIYSAGTLAYACESTILAAAVVGVIMSAL